MLRLAKLTDYALVVLSHLARNAHVCVHPATDVADATGIPQPTVSKVLKTLSREGLVTSTRGAHGGYALARDPRDVNVADVIAAMEGPLALTACATDDGGGCAEEHHCHLSGHWPRINRAVVDGLRRVSLLELAGPPQRLNLRTNDTGAARATGK